MNDVSQLVLIGNSLPRRCGIATFTMDLRSAIAARLPRCASSIVAMTAPGQSRADYPPEVAFDVEEDVLAEYLSAAERLNAMNVDVVSLQHEFGIFGGPAGSHVVPLLSALKMPVVTTLHTVLASPTAEQRTVLERVVAKSTRVVVMAEKGRELLRSIYGVPDSKIDVIPHGIPDIDFAEPAEFKQRLGFSDRPVILTFGLLSPNKGIEFMIDAMPRVLKSCPNAVYVVLGATHPNLVRENGEEYRASLISRAEALGVADHIAFEDQFVDRDLLLEYIGMCDVYVTPYLSEAQMTSGTLAYSFGSGKAVVSTPYWHATELLADGRGIVVPFHDADALATSVADLLTDDVKRDALRKRAYAVSRSMTWQNTADKYVASFEKAKRSHRLRVVERRPTVSAFRPPAALPMVRTEYFLSLCDDTGLLQHAVYSIADRSHGYCVDDNARALLLSCSLKPPKESLLPEVLTSRFAAFIQNAWNPDNGRFRNFMSYDRRWLEERGSEDSHGRTVWALGVCARDDSSASRRQWAGRLFFEALQTAVSFQSPRANAFTLLGIAAIGDASPLDAASMRIRDLLVGRLMRQLAAAETPDWTWFEDGLSYDNARLPQALIATGLSTGDRDTLQAGLRTLRWLMERQSAPAGHFRPVGSQSFGDIRTDPRPFDQQPLEAAATISACRAAFAADRDEEWLRNAERAFAWFSGDNDVGVSLIDPENGACRDGLHPRGVNLNQGAELVLSYLLSVIEICSMSHRAFERPLADVPGPGARPKFGRISTKMPYVAWPSAAEAPPVDSNSP